MMNDNTKVLTGILVSLVGVFLWLPLLVGGTGSPLFLVLFWSLVLAIAVTLFLTITSWRRLH